MASSGLSTYIWGGAFNVRAHDPFDAADSSEAHDVVNACAAVPQALAQRLHRNVEADPAAVLEAVRHRLGWDRDRNVHALDRVTLNPRRQRLAARTNDRRHHRRIPRRPVLGFEHQPHGVWKLGRQSMKQQSGEEADCSARNHAGHFGEAVRPSEFSIGQLVQTPAVTHQNALDAQAFQIRARNPGGIKVAGARNPSLSGDLDRSGMCYTDRCRHFI